jgi:hypothetical protein
VRLSLDLSNPTHTSPITHNVNIGGSIRGFFRTKHTSNDPASLETTTPLPSNALYVSSSVPSPLIPGQTAQVQVTMQNLGGTTWTSGGANPFRLGAQNPQDNSTWGSNRVELPHDVAPGDEVTFDFPITAPTAPGTYHFQWRMVQELVTWFGDFTADVPIVVAPVLRTMSTTITPSPLLFRRPVLVTVTATDGANGTTLSGSVTIDGVPRGVTGTPFSLTITGHRVRAADGTWDWEPVIPTGQVLVPGYRAGTITFDVAA